VNYSLMMEAAWSSGPLEEWYPITTLHFTLNMGAARSSKTLVSYCNITLHPEDGDSKVL